MCVHTGVPVCLFDGFIHLAVGHQVRASLEVHVLTKQIVN